MKVNDGIKKALVILMILLFCMIGIIMFIGEKEVKKRASLVVIEDLISRQEEVASKIEDALKDNKYNLKNPYVLENPYEISPLTSLIVFKTEKKESIEVFLNGKKYYESPVTNEHIIPVVGLVANKDNELNIKASDEEHSFSIKTSVKGVNTANTPIKNEGNYYLTSSLDNNLDYLIYDGSGNVVWYLDLESYGSVELLDNNTYIVPVEENNRKVNDGLYVIDYMGRIIKRIDTKYGYKSDLEVIDDNQVIVVGDNSIIYTLNIQDGSIVKEINVVQILKEIDITFADELDIRSIDYRDGNILVAVNGLDMIFNIDYDNKKLNWVYANKDELSNKFSSYVLNANNSVRYIKQIEQVVFMRNGISVYGSLNDVSKGFMLTIDENIKTARLYTALEDKVLSSNYGGFVTYLDSDLVTYANVLENDKKISKIVEYNNLGNKIYESIIDGSLYRSEKITMPKYSNNYEVSTYTYINKQDEVKIDLSSTLDGKKYRDALKLYANSYEVTLDNDSYKTFSLIFKNKDYEMIIPYKGRMTYYDIDAGIYKVYVKINDEYYDLDKEVTFS